MFPEGNGIYTGYMESTANVQYNSNNPKSNPTETCRPSPPKSPEVLSRISDHEPLPLPKRRRPRPALVVPPTQPHLPDSEIQEIFPATNKPYDLPLPPTPAYSVHTPILQATHSQMVSTEQHHDGQLNQLDDSMCGADDSYKGYKDYGEHDTAEGYEATEATAGRTKDASNGNIQGPI